MIILSGIVGSTAYGLNNENSDIDTLGVFVNPTKSYWSLDKPPETKTQSKPDCCYHEIEKFLRLCLGCNPTVMELLWLESYEIVHPIHGERLINLRKKFLYTERVASAYGGYAISQIKKLRTSNSWKKFKHARHCFRLLRQGKELLTTGELTLKVKNSDEYKIFESMPIDQIEDLFAREYAEFRAARSVLPDKPEITAVNDYLYKVRSTNLWD
jgi:hypothetical protein